MESFKSVMGNAPAYMLLEQELSRKLEFPKFCIECGSKNIDHCPKCKKADIVMHAKYCGDRGKPLPWTEEALKAAREITDQSEDLTLQQKEELKATFPYLIIESPRSPVEAKRFKGYVTKIAPALKELLQRTLESVFAETAKAIIFGP